VFARQSTQRSWENRRHEADSREKEK